ncbi:hypothetical protein EDD86DRAFT_208805 [Gorgonomyces haynaldii]|nr:hypothetical protein EDD86DRAFT_208805 [Gorgonomyces haynaldii]
MFAFVVSVAALPNYAAIAPVATSTPCTSESLPTVAPAVAPIPTVVPTALPEVAKGYGAYGAESALPVAAPTSTPCSEEALPTAAPTAVETALPAVAPTETPCSEEALPTAAAYPTGTAEAVLPVETAPAGYGQTAPILSGGESSFVSVAALAVVILAL